MGTTYRYLKLEILKILDSGIRTTSGRFELREWTFSNSQGNEYLWPNNVSLEASSSAAPSYPISNLVDNDKSTLAAGTSQYLFTLPYTLVIDLGSGNTIDLSQYSTYTFYGNGKTKYPYTFNIYGSNDKSNWDLLDEQDEVSFDTTTYQFTATIQAQPAISKVIYGDRTLIDLTSDTVDASALKSGVTAHGADGQLITGSLPVYDTEEF